MEPDLFPGAPAAFTDGERATHVPIERLETLRQELRELREREPLNAFQRWILDERYTLEVPPSDFPIRSILLVAVPHAPYARVELRRRGARVRCVSLVASDFEEEVRALEARLAGLGLRVIPAPDLPLKRLAARSGLARYGRNNVCYVEGMGSHFSLAACFTDLPCTLDRWVELRVPAACDRCTACLRSCPTGAIRRERFLIDNERCLSYLNEGPAPFPAWLPASAHHALYDCLRCQERCPLNRALDLRPATPVRLDEAETEALLAGVPVDRLEPALQEKARRLGLQRWPPEAIARNVRVLFESCGEPA